MLSQDMVCGYYFNLCGGTVGDVYYTQDTSAAYRTEVLNGAPLASGVSTNDALDGQYSAVNPSGTTFNIMWLSDPEIDQSYSVGSAKNCNDHACCHSNK